MVKFIKPGKVVIFTNGRFAGKKAIVIKTFDEGTKERHYGHCLVVGLEREPLKVTKAMSKKKILKRSKIKPFIKFVNYSHLMPTRYTISDMDFKTVATESLDDTEVKLKAKKTVKDILQQRYLERGKNSSGVQYLYSKLRF